MMPATLSSISIDAGDVQLAATVIVGLFVAIAWIASRIAPAKKPSKPSPAPAPTTPAAANDEYLMSKLMAASNDLAKANDEIRLQSDSNANLRHELMTLRSEFDAYRRSTQSEIEQLRILVSFLTAQLRQSGAIPETDAADTTTPDGAMRAWAAEHFTVDEMRVLAVDLGIAQDAIGAQTPDTFALELLSYASRRGQLDKLGRAMRKARPGVAGW